MIYTKPKTYNSKNNHEGLRLNTNPIIFRQVLRFYLIVLPSFIIGGIGIYQFSRVDLLIWLALIAIFFLVIENRVLCIHCPYYAGSACFLRCGANFGIPKLWKYQPDPMNFLEKSIMIAGFIIIWGFPVIFLSLMKNWILLIAYLVSVIFFFSLLRLNNCRKCVNFCCPLNSTRQKNIDQD